MPDFEAAFTPRVVSFTASSNARSRRVMERLGMLRDPREDFDHAALPAAHPLRPHVLYRLPLARWRAAVDRPPGGARSPAEPAADG